MEDLTKVSIGLSIKFRHESGEEPYFSLLQEFRNSYVGMIKSKDDKDILLFNVDDIEQYKIIYEAIQMVFSCEHVENIDKKFFMRNMKNYLSEGKDICDKYPCNVAVFSDDTCLTRYFVEK